MKAGIPDTGMVIRLEGENAVVRMKSEGSCYKCGAAALGLCKAGQMHTLTVRNPKQARVGDTVKIGLVNRVQFEAYALAYVIPVIALILGAAIGHALGRSAGFPPLDIIVGFSGLIVASFFSFRRLRRLDSTSSIEIVDVLFDPWYPGHQESDRCC